MHFLSATSQAMPETVYDELAAYRYSVFVERLGWELPSEPGYEQDQFDHAGTVHIVARHDDDDHVIGCGRLLPSTGRYLLESVFPELLNGLPVPRDAKTWELSRFAAMDVSPVPGAPIGRRDYLAERVLLEALRYCVQRGVTTLLAVTTLPVERLMQRAGVDMHRLGPPIVSGGQPICGFVIRVNEQSLNALAAFETLSKQAAAAARNAGAEQLPFIPAAVAHADGAAMHAQA